MIIQKQKGFTIVELLIVIVVIGILAAITIIAFNGIQDKARQTQVSAAANQAGKKIRLYQVENEAYPSNLATVGIANTSTITYDYTQNGQWFCVSAKTASGTSFTAGASSTGNCAQLNVSYYNNNALTGSPALTRLEPNVNYNWGGNAPAPGIQSDNFSAVWSGTITAPVTDTYTLYMWYDDRFRLYIDNVLVSDQWSTGCCVERTMTYPFVANQTLPFKIEMAENAGGAGAIIQWSYTGQTKTPIPPSAFSSL
jgi:prepilin-type N-terminal cleavage/methylation domain-containing protein